MNISIRDILEEQSGADILILPFFEDYSTDTYSALDLLVNGLISKVIRSRDFIGRHGQNMLLPVSNINASRILLTGLGKRQGLSQEKIRQAGAKAFSAVKEIGLVDVAVSARIFGHLSGELHFAQKPVFYFLEGGLLGIYRFEKYKTTQDNGKFKKDISSITVLDGDKTLPVAWLRTLVSATFLARDLVNTPSNDMTPTTMANISKSLAGKG
jgi:leucyl aminopeptidase